MKNDVLSMWTVFERPKDYPISFVARRFEVGSVPSPRPTTDMFVADSLEEIRALLPRGLVRITRDPKDHPSVVETWI